MDHRNRALKARTPRASLEMRFDNVVVEFEEYPAAQQYSSRLLVLMKDAKIMDHMET